MKGGKKNNTQRNGIRPERQILTSVKCTTSPNKQILLQIWSLIVNTVNGTLTYKVKIKKSHGDILMQVCVCVYIEYGICKVMVCVCRVSELQGTELLVNS